MQIDLDRNDLLPKHFFVACSATRFKHFKPSIRKIIKLAGKATFKTNGGTNYNVIYPPAKP